VRYQKNLITISVPSRIVDIRSVIMNIDEKIGAIVG
jgi:hypothetical protein